MEALAVTAVMFSSGDDVVTYLKEQHQQIRAMFDAVSSSSGKARTTAFLALRRMLAIHEAAEEEIVHPIARVKLTNGMAMIDKRLSEEHACKVCLAALEEMDVESASFLESLQKLKEKVVAHADAEEREEFELLGNILDPVWLVRMRKAAAFAEAIAPTRPHAGLEAPAAHFLFGPFVAMMDRARDALSGRA